MSCPACGRPLAWRSPTGNIAPGLYEPQGIGWLRGFHGGLLTTCGLRNTGIPSDDEGEHHDDGGSDSGDEADDGEVDD